jgi:hypothetical protein
MQYVRKQTFNFLTNFKYALTNMRTRTKTRLAFKPALGGYLFSYNQWFYIYRGNERIGQFLKIKNKMKLLLMWGNRQLAYGQFCNE